jgi:hypothetical protein
MDKTYCELINKLSEYSKLSAISGPERFAIIYLLEHRHLNNVEILLDIKERIRSLHQEAAA